MKLFIQYANNKFVHSLEAVEGDILTACGFVDNNLYNMHYHYNFDMYIFNSNLFTNEIYQFIEEYKHTNRMVIHHDKIINYNLLSLTDNITHIAHTSHPNIIEIPRLVNTHIFYDTHQTSPRKDNIVCFLDNYSILPSELEAHIYPQSDIKLQLFSKAIRHQQNFGFVTEKDKAKILNDSQSYLDIDGLYGIEASLCGSKILAINNNGDIIDGPTDLPEYTTYINFIESITT